MLRIFKYRIQINDYFELDLPRGAKILTVGVQQEVPYLWALINPEAELETRIFRFVGTGHQIEEGVESLKFINTFQMRNGALVFHIFEVIN